MEGFRPQPAGKALAKITGVDDRDAAAKLSGFFLGVPRADLPQTAADEFYWHDLVGMRALGRDGKPLGKVAGLIRTGAHDILRIAVAEKEGDEGEGEGEGGSGSEILIPFVSECAPEVDLESGVIRTEWEADW